VLTSLPIVLVGLLMNVSKAGHIMALLLACAYLLMLMSRWAGIIHTYGWREPLILAAFAAVGVAAMLFHLDWDQALVRWNQYLASGPGDSRLAVASICLQMAGDAGWFGFGPGSFDAAFQHHVHQHQLAAFGPGIGVRWINAHNDYLQTLLDWGFIGTALWACFWFTPLSSALRHVYAEMMFNRRRRVRRQEDKAASNRQKVRTSDPLKAGVSISILGIFIHAAYDFPLQIPGIELYTVVLASILSAIPATLKKSTTAG
jgi:O-antigen ligase